MVLFCLSTAQFVWGHNGVLVLCSIPRVLRKSSNSFDVKLDALSVLKLSGNPNLQKIVSRHSITFSVVIDFKISTSKNLLK